ncbi:hypothetical protein M1N23_03495 [Dehalococcoidia bacterium]|nr:hypothetical protein [Dehalococcoidia bacterium]
MPQSGQELLQHSIDTCNEIASGLGKQNQAWEESLVEIVENFREVSGSFFFKTILSIPVTRGTVREAGALLELRNSQDWDGFGQALPRLIESAQDVIEQAGMKGVTLT